MRHCEAEWLKAMVTISIKAAIHTCEEINNRSIKEIYNKCQQYVQHCVVFVYIHI